MITYLSGWWLNKPPLSNLKVGIFLSQVSGKTKKVPNHQPGIFQKYHTCTHSTQPFFLATAMGLPNRSSM